MSSSVDVLPDESTRWNEWIVPLSVKDVTLRAILDSAAHMKAGQDDIPFVVQLFENPRFKMPFMKLFSGAADINTHDCIHALLGRGLLAKDEAFVIGFTMGSTRRITHTAEMLFTLATKYLYPAPYKFNDDEIQIYKDALRLGYISNCQPLNRIDYTKYMDWEINRLRKKLGLERDLLKAYYHIENRRFPYDAASKRLL